MDIRQLYSAVTAVDVALGATAHSLACGIKPIPEIGCPIGRCCGWSLRADLR